MENSAGLRRAPVSVGLPVVVGCCLFFVYLLTFPGAIAPRSSDGRAMYLVTRAIVDRHDIAIQPGSPGLVAVAPGWNPIPIPTNTACPKEPAVIGIGSQQGGPFFSKYGLGQSLAAIPLYATGLLAAGLTPAGVHDEAAAFVTSAYTAIVTALTAALLCALALRLCCSGCVALSLSLLYGLATPAWAYTTNFFSEPTVGLCLLVAVAAMLWSPDIESPRTVLLAGSSLAVAMLTHVADSALYVPMFALFVCVRARREQVPGLLAWASIPIAIALGVTAIYDAARFGSPFITGYGIAGDVHDMHPPHTLMGLWEGIYGPILSPGKGLLLYAPILLLSPWAFVQLGRRDRATALLLVGVAAVDVLTHANTLIVWLGGWAWGPRFLVPIIPVLLLPVGLFLQQCGTSVRRVAWGLAALGVLVQVPGVLLDKGAYIGYLAAQRGCIWDAEALYKWNPRYSPIIGQWGRLLDPATYSANTGIEPTAANVANGKFVPEPQPWWSLLANQGADTRVLITVCAALLVGAALMGALALYLARLTPPAMRRRVRRVGA